MLPHGAPAALTGADAAALELRAVDSEVCGGFGAGNVKVYDHDDAAVVEFVAEQLRAGARAAVG